MIETPAPMADAENSARFTARRLRVRLIEFHLAHHCNLTCTGCSHFSPSAAGSSVSGAEAENQFRLAAGRLDPEFIHLLGGEPLLNPILPVLLPLARVIFPAAVIKLVTNGVLLERRASALLPALVASRVTLAVSLYPGIDIDCAFVSEACETAGAEVEFWKQDTFLDFIDPKGRSDPAQARAECPMEDALNVRDGRLYPCPVTAWSDFGGLPLARDDGISLSASPETLSAVADRARVTSKCRFCRACAPRRPHRMGDRLPPLGLEVERRG